MGEHNVNKEQSEQQAQRFMKMLLTDLSALERMIELGLLESGTRHIGAEQEMFLVDNSFRPLPVAPELLERVTDPRLTTEIGRFNLEANLTPRVFTSGCLSGMEAELRDVIDIAERGAARLGGNIVLTGILPTLRQSDLRIENLTPIPRYFELNETLKRLRGDTFNVRIKGLDELEVLHDNVLLEACCTSFQIHLQVGAREFPLLYNWAQAITAPLLAAAANSPLLLGRRLWHETRIALFQLSVDERSNIRHTRGSPPRVSFGESWIKDSVTEIFREEIARYRVVLTRDIQEDSLVVLNRGDLPDLSALRLHNGTIWRWNRPCYGINGNQAHLRIENRILPSGPSPIDEIANAAFFFGLMQALPREYGDVTARMPFDDAKDNFFAAARHGLKAQFTWLDGTSIPAALLILDHLLPLARKGLADAGIDSNDISRYLDVFQHRIEKDQNGSLWMLRSLASIERQGTKDMRERALVAETIEQQRSNTPVHKWPLAKLDETRSFRQTYKTVGQFMSTDLFTVRSHDLIDLVACVMDWKHVRHVPVEDDAGRLKGLVSHRDLLKWMSRAMQSDAPRPVTVEEIMVPDPIWVSPETTTVEAIDLMRSRKVGCLPVLENGRLVGIVTAYDFLAISTELIRNQLNYDPTSD